MNLVEIQVVCAQAFQGSFNLSVNYRGKNGARQGDSLVWRTSSWQDNYVEKLDGRA